MNHISLKKIVPYLKPKERMLENEKPKLEIGLQFEAPGLLVHVMLAEPVQI